MRPAFRVLIVVVVGAACTIPFWHGFGHASDPMERLVVRNAMTTSIEAFRMDVGRYPTTEEGLKVLIHAPQADKERWRGPYIEGIEIPKDPWGHDYIYRAPATMKGFPFEVISLGPDGKISDDDVSSITK